MFLEQRLSNPKQAHSFTGLFWISNVRYGGSPPSPPPPPPPPDYAAANRAGVIADVESLGARRQIEQAARLGGTALQFGVEQRGENRLKQGYQEVPYQAQIGTRTENYTERQGRRTVTRQREVPVYETRYRYVDPNGREVSKGDAYASQAVYYKLFDEDGKRLSTPREISASEAVVNFSGMSDLDIARAQADFQREETQANAQTALDLQKEYGTQFASEARNQLQAIDPTGFANRERLGSLVRDTQFERAGDGPSFTQTGFGPQYEMASGGPTFSRQNYGPQFQLGSETEGGGAAAIGRAEVERQLGEGLFNQGKLSEEESRRLNNAVRGAQVARGNVYGNAPTAEEVLARSGAETERARQARADVVGYLQSGQSSYDIAKAVRQEANQLAQQGYINYQTALGVNNQLSQQEYQNQQGALGQRNQAQQAMYQNQLGATAANNQLAQQAYQNQLGAITQRNAASQQQIANLQSYAGLQPIVTQGAQLGGLGQGAAPMMQTPIPQGVNINPQAGQLGTNFALGVYDNQTRQYNAQLDYMASTYASSQQNSPLNYITGIGGLIPKFI